MLSKNKLKYIHSLSQKKYRDAENAFIAEGPKLIGDLMGGYECLLLAATPEYWGAHPQMEAREIFEITADELTKASLLKTPQSAIAVFRKTRQAICEANPEEQLVLALDAIQNPGNLGTIIRIADWFGIKHIFCSTDTVDAFSPKAIQATMGAISRVQIHYVDLPEYLCSQPSSLPVYGMLLDGKNIYEEPLQQRGIIVMGNEGNGISSSVKRHVNRKLLIPNYPPGSPTSDSLNVAVATAITCAEFRRRALSL